MHTTPGRARLDHDIDKLFPQTVVLHHFAGGRRHGSAADALTNQSTERD